LGDFTIKNPANILFRSITCANWLLIIPIFITAIIWPNIGPDGGYYLSIARDFYQDKTGIYNMVCGYNPLAILILGFPYWLSDSNPYQFSVVLLLIIQSTNAFLFYRILKKLEIPYLYRYLFTSFFLLYSLLLDGTFIVLELVQILFLLSATLLLLNNKFFLSGAFVFLAFYSKQYSLAFLAGFSIYLIIDKSDTRKKILYMFRFIIGFAIILVFFYLLLAKNMKFPEFLSDLIGIRVINSTAFSQITGANYDFKNFLKIFMLIVLIAPVMFLWILYLKDIRINKITGFLIGNISGFLAVFIFASYFHYFILFIPWCLILTSILVSVSGLNHKINFDAVLFSLAFISVSLFTYKSIKNRMIIYKQEMGIKENISSLIPPGSKVFLYGASPAQYIYSSLKSANAKELGYMFPNLRELSYYLDKMDEKSLILVNTGEMGTVNNCTDFELVAQSDHFTVFEKR